jgi:hypothetical protein
MRWGIFLALSAAVAGCGKSQQDKDTIALAEKMGVFDKEERPFTDGLPERPIRCSFEKRAYCIGAECRNLPSSRELAAAGKAMYVEIDKAAMTYKRCGPKIGDCTPAEINFIGPPFGFQSLSAAGGTVLFKYQGNGRFVDIATQGPETFVSEGKCKPANSPSP